MWPCSTCSPFFAGYDKVHILTMYIPLVGEFELSSKPFLSAAFCRNAATWDKAQSVHLQCHDCSLLKVWEY